MTRLNLKVCWISVVTVICVALAVLTSTTDGATTSESPSKPSPTTQPPPSQPPTENSYPQKDGFGPGKQYWDFVEVRPGAFMFYWLYYTTADVGQYTDKPLAIWLQGGPGASSSGFGNFEELGPLDLELNERNFTWVKDMNVLFIDNPVGTGFSYVKNNKLLCKTNKQISRDLVELMRGFYKRLPQFRSTPLHIFSESYGGKMSAEFALMLHEEITQGSIESNLKSIASIDGWLSPMDSMWSWAPFLFNLGFVDQDGFYKINNGTQKAQDALDARKYIIACNEWAKTEGIIWDETNGIDFYNVMVKQTSASRLKKNELLKSDIENAMFQTLTRYDARDLRDDLLEELMRGPVSAALKIPDNVVFGSQSKLTFSVLRNDFMRPATHIIERLLNETDIRVSIVSGQLDLIVATPGTVKWVNNLNSIYSDKYKSNDRSPMIVDDVLEGYIRRAGPFSMYWVDRAGHMVPADNPAAMKFILQYVTDNYSVK